ncbi:MAG: diguanylate cyclase [Clostridiales bacterium]|nr:diguanylate cyclase [Clostridiales bacterium]
MKIKHQLILTHGILVVLALIVVFINVVAYKSMESDANIINQAGKLRMLSYNMAQLSNRMVSPKHSDNIFELKASLTNRIEEFEGILDVLTTNSRESDAIINHTQSQMKLEKITKEWAEIFKPNYLVLLDNEFAINYCDKINEKIDAYVSNIDEMVNLFSLYAKGKVTKAIVVNGGLIAVIILVTMYSFITTNQRIRKPMDILIQELKALSLFDDDVSNKLRNINTDEISEMTEYFNEMMYDQLTHTFNRKAGLSKLNRLVQFDNGRHLKLSMCFIDINGLKEVNDLLGHKFGDELIVDAVEAIKKEIREEDFIIRMGGDEFLIVFRGIDEEHAENAWQRINQRYDQINKTEDRRYIISVSHGIVAFDNYEKSELEMLIRTADDRMYIEKKYIKEELKVKFIKDQI